MTFKQIISSIFGVFKITLASDFQIPSTVIDNGDWNAKEVYDDDDDD